MILFLLTAPLYYGAVFCYYVSMTENEFLLNDRIQKIQSINFMYNLLDKSYISFSGGKDSTVLSFLVDLALPDNKIPRIHVNTGIELKMIEDFVKKLAENDKRIVIVNSGVNIKQMLKEIGYPFKSKFHSYLVHSYQRNGYLTPSMEHYIDKGYGYSKKCPAKLKYQFTQSCNLKISNKCCDTLKKKVIKKKIDELGKTINMNGMRSSEEGLRGMSSGCILMKGDGITAFHPLFPVTDQWMSWFIKEYKIELSPIYYPPYNFERTGCKGCPFNKNLQKELNVLQQFFPGEYRQCEDIWEPCYTEMRRIKFRLKPKETFLF